MNDTTPSDSAQGPTETGQGPSAQQNASAPFGSGFFSWLRGLGIVRGGERWFAGVASGIAARAGIDPIIVRGVFVVLALLGGPGLLLYAAGWLLLPDSSGRIHVEEVVRGRASTGMIVTAAVVSGLVIVPVFFGLILGGAPLSGTPSFWGWDLWTALGVPRWVLTTTTWLFWIAVAIAGFFLIRHFVLQRGREQSAQNRGADAQHDDSTAAPDRAPFAADPAGSYPAGSAQGGSAPADPQAYPATPATPTAPTIRLGDQTREFADRAEDFAARTGEQAKEWGARAGEKASAWSADVGRQADEWSARYAERHEARKLGPVHTVLTLALALLAGGLALFWALGTGFAGVDGGTGALFIPWTLAAIAMLAVLGISLIVAGIRGRSTGWVGFLAFCGVVALICSTVLPIGTQFRPFGDIRVPGTGAPGTVVIAGDTDIDLRDLDDEQFGGGTAGDDIVVWQLAGNSTITLPDNGPAVARVRVLAGNVSEETAGRQGFRVSGPFLQHSAGSGLEDVGDTVAESEATRVTVYLLAGNVRIEGGADGSIRESGSRVADQDERTGDDRSVQELRAEESDLNEELDQVEWRLEEPGISAEDRRDLEQQRDTLRDDIDEIEKELAR